MAEMVNAIIIGGHKIRGRSLNSVYVHLQIHGMTSAGAFAKNAIASSEALPMVGNGFKHFHVRASLVTPAANRSLNLGGRHK